MEKSNIEHEGLVSISMQVILHSGDARTEIMNALTELSSFEYIKAKKTLERAKEQLTRAHQIQTDIVQSEARGDSYVYSILFSHAQDTLMTVYSEYNVASKLVEFTKGIDDRFKKLEDLNASKE